MRTRRGRFVALTMAVAGVAVIIASSYWLRTRLLEEWYVWQAVNGEAAEQAAAIETLGKMRAVDALLRVMRLSAEQRPCAASDGNIGVRLSRTGTLARDEILNLGEDAAPALFQEATLNHWNCAFFAAFMLDRVATGAWTHFRRGATDEAAYVALVLRDVGTGKLQMPVARLVPAQGAPTTAPANGSQASTAVSLPTGDGNEVLSPTSDMIIRTTEGEVIQLGESMDDGRVGRVSDRP
jgi:hypothetical protein